jgi:anti-sigma factor RsiW
MTCAECLELLAAFLDSELESGEHGAVRSHLAGCPDCAEECASLRRAQLALGSWGEAEADPGELVQAVAELRVRVRRLEQELLHLRTGDAAPASGPLLPAGGAERRLRLIV